MLKMPENDLSVSRRNFLKLSAAGTLGSLVSPFTALEPIISVPVTAVAQAIAASPEIFELFASAGRQLNICFYECTRALIHHDLRDIPELLNPDQDNPIPSKSRLFRWYNTEAENVIEEKRKIESQARKLLEELTEFKNKILCELRTTSQTATIENLNIDHEFIDKVVSNYFGDFPSGDKVNFFAKKEIEAYFRISLTGTPQQLETFVQTFVNRGVDYLEKSLEIRAKITMRDLTLRHLDGDVDDEDYLDRKEVMEKLGIDGNVVGIKPRLLTFNMHQNAFMINGIDMTVADPNGKTSTKPLQNWQASFLSLVQDFAGEVKIIGEEEPKQSYILLTKANSRAAKYLDNAAKERETQIQVTK